MSESLRLIIQQQAVEIANLTAQLALVLEQADEVQARLTMREHERESYTATLRERDLTIAHLKSQLQRAREHASQARARKAKEFKASEPASRTPKAIALKCASCKHGKASDSAELGWYCEAGWWRVCDPERRATRYTRR